jgi:Patatin-like phospholipase
MSYPALNIAQVLWDERMALEGRPLPSEALDAPGGHIKELDKDFADLGAGDLPATYRLLRKDNRWALCLSGGGIRSAAFALGIMQRLAEYYAPAKWSAEKSEPLLQQFDYLSTVSGGGYVGSWFSAWLLQERRAGGGAGDVLNKLNGRTGDHDEFPPINNLRRDSHYLAPSFSAISPDVWSDIANVVRNLFLNWILLVPPMILAVLVTQALGYAFVDALTSDKNTGWTYPVSFATAVCIIFSLSFAAANRPTRGLANNPQSRFLVCDLMVFIVGAVLLASVLANENGRDVAASAALWLISLVLDTGHVAPSAAVLMHGAALGFGVYLISWFLALGWRSSRLYRAPAPVHYKKWNSAVDLAAWCAAGVAFGTLVSAGFLLVQWISAHLISTHWISTLADDPVQRASLVNAIVGAIVGVCGVPWILGARIVGDVIAAAGTEIVPMSDANLEYQARSGGLYALAQVGWLVWFGLVLSGSLIAREVWSTTATGWLISAGGISGLASGAAALIIGSSSKTAGFVQAAKTARQYLGLNTLAAIAAAIFAAILVVGLSIAVAGVMSLYPNGSSGVVHPTWTTIGVGMLLLVFLIFAASVIININRFSLHGLYRNRLVRAFLGASRSEKDRDGTKNRFTDFDSIDTPLLHHLWEHGVPPHGNQWKPLHIINVAINLVSSKNLAWQERMAASFTFSPLHCGSGSEAFPNGAFRLSYPLGDRKPYGGTIGLTLGTAMAISGAAVSPNMGYNTSPGVAFLMTLFNVRLGWWLGNPRTENPLYYYTGPRFALRPLAMEMFGLTSEIERWVYLSDGGHFENLGLYEMVRRRCRVIVVSDGGCDPSYQFEDLGNAVRKIWIDLGVQIDFIGLDRLKKRFEERPTPAKSEPYWAVGRIRYTLADGNGDGTDNDGWLLYIKSGIHGTEPMDVLSYAVSHPTFPHETTANQFFSESQFEAYRMLGYEIVDSAIDYAKCERDAAAPPAQPDAAIQAAPAKGPRVPEVPMTLVEVIKHLQAQLKRPVPKTA